MRDKAERPSILSLKIIYALFVYKDGLTIKKIVEEVKADYKNVHNAVEGLFRKGAIKKKKIGSYNICSLNCSNDEIIEYLKGYNFYIRLREFRRKHPVEYRTINDTCQTVITEGIISPLFICLLFGSYSKNEESENSDIDLLFLYPLKEERVKSALALAASSMYRETHGEYSPGFTFQMHPDILDTFTKTINKINKPYQNKFHITEQDIKSFTIDLNKKDKLSIAAELSKEPPIVFYGDDIFFRIMIEYRKK